MSDRRYNHLMSSNSKVTHFFFLITVLNFSVISLANTDPPLFCAQKYRELIHSFAPKNPQNLPIKIGIEVEFSQPLNVKLDQTAELIRKVVGTRYRVVTLTHRPLDDVYEIDYQKTNFKTKKWTVKTDLSIKTSQTPVEIASPILEDEEDFLQFKNIISAIKSSGAKIEPKSGGVHVHVDFGYADSGELALLAAVFAEIEDELKVIFSSHSSRIDFIRSTSDELLKLLIENSFDLKNPRPPFIQDLLRAQGRHHALNLRAYNITRSRT